MNKQNMKKYQNILLTISKKVSSSLSYKYRYDKQELESYCITVLIEKCGDVVYNTDIDQEFLYNSLYSKSKKILYRIYFESKFQY